MFLTTRVLLTNRRKCKTKHLRKDPEDPVSGLSVPSFVHVKHARSCLTCLCSFPTINLTLTQLHFCVDLSVRKTCKRSGTAEVLCLLRLLHHCLLLVAMAMSSCVCPHLTGCGPLFDLMCARVFINLHSVWGVQWFLGNKSTLWG